MQEIMYGAYNIQINRPTLFNIVESYAKESFVLVMINFIENTLKNQRLKITQLE